MEKYSRSKSSREDVRYDQPGMMHHDLRSYSTSYYKPPYQNTIPELNTIPEYNNNKVKKSGGGLSSSSKNNWSFNMDPELQRKKRVAGYKAYAVEGKMKGSFRKSFRWIKDVVSHGLW